VQVSFIIPLFNNLALTRACVESLQATLPPGFTHEIILVDDGSTDGTRDWLATLAAPYRVVLNERNLGYAGANNRGIKIAQGDLLVLLNNDLVLLPRWLEPMLAAHGSFAGRAGLIGNVQREVRTGLVDHTGIVVNAQGKPVHDRTPPSWLARLVFPLRVVPAVTGACVLVERALWQELGGFDEAYVNGGEDVDLCFRARAAGRTNAVALRSIVRHHVSASLGRKARDEENSYRLARRWRREFVLAADGPMRAWCRERFDLILREPHYTDRDLAWRTWRYANGLTKEPLPEALAYVESEQAKEFAHWEKLFSMARSG
jgi:GT2 family glycosyltransferase